VRRVAFATLGCKLNQYETELLREAFEARAYETVPFRDDAEVYVINTCTVTQRADRQSRQLVRQAARRSPGSTILVTGCSAEVAPEEMSAIPGVTRIVPNSEKLRVAEMVAGRPPGVSGQDGFWPAARRLTRFGGHTRAFVKIQDGCDWRCTYCVIPRARGEAKSRPADEIVEEICLLSSSGHREVVLTGISIGRYRSQNGGDLAGLVERILGETDLERLRISSIEPTDVTEHLVELLSRNGRICRHVHLPLQSGSDRILARMNRPYTLDSYQDVVEGLRARVTDLALGTDLIVGFPGEDDAAFEVTRAAVGSLPFAYLHIFPFSARPGTVAATFEDQVSPQTRRERADIMRELGKLMAEDFRRRYVGRTLDALVETRPDRETGLLVGVTGNYLRILFEGPRSIAGTFQPVRVTGLGADGRLRGRVS
jgi:threonylcarbamoyladenosine tRNA methylthiotransferase MtaB